MRGTVALLASVVLLAACGGSELDGDWRAMRANVDGVEIAGLDTVVVTMEIDGDRITGSSGCNQYDTAVEIDGDTIVFGEGAATDMFCDGPPGEIEAVFYGLTSGAADWSIDAGALTLTTPTSVWVFERSNSAPVVTTPATTVTNPSVTTAPAVDTSGPAVEVRPVGGCSPADGDGPAPDGSLGQDVLVDRLGVERCFVGPAIGAVFDSTATVSLDPPTGEWVVVADVRADARDAWDELTGLCFSREAPCASGRIAVVLDGEIVTSPTVLSPVLPQVQIAGAFTESEAQLIAAAINLAP